MFPEVRSSNTGTRLTKWSGHSVIPWTISPPLHRQLKQLLFIAPGRGGSSQRSEICTQPPVQPMENYRQCNNTDSRSLQQTQILQRRHHRPSSPAPSIQSSILLVCSSQPITTARTYMSRPHSDFLRPPQNALTRTVLTCEKSTEWRVASQYWTCQGYFTYFEHARRKVNEDTIVIPEETSKRFHSAVKIYRYFYF